MAPHVPEQVSALATGARSVVTFGMAAGRVEPAAAIEPLRALMPRASFSAAIFLNAVVTATPTGGAVEETPSSGPPVRPGVALGGPIFASAPIAATPSGYCIEETAPAGAPARAHAPFRLARPGHAVAMMAGLAGKRIARADPVPAGAASAVVPIAGGAAMFASERVIPAPRAFARSGPGPGGSPTAGGGEFAE